ncbi:MAG: ABC transporter permease subunit [Spiroplasma sp.]
MVQFQQKRWFWSHRSRLFLGSRELQSSVSKFKGSVFAVILGLIIGAIVIAATGNNAFTYFHYLLFFAFSSYGFNNWDNTLVWWAIYIIAGLALVISFKAGMFNIGIAGQMLAAGAVVIAIGIRYDLSQPVAIIVALISGVLAAVLTATVTALLKVLFNVHEVVTSILLNWTIWYLVKWLFTTTKDLYDDSRGSSLPVHDSMSFSIADYKFILPLILAFILVIIVWFLLKKTTLGYKVKAVGLNPFAADYAGISRRKYAFTSFVISGALAGFMGVIYYAAMNPSLSFASDVLPAIGFDSISVALVGQINPFGIVAAAFLWGLIKSGGPIGSVGLGIPNAISDVIFGVIIYSAACAILLSKIAPIKFLISYFNIVFSKQRRKIFHQYLNKIWKNWLKTFQIKRKYQQKISAVKKANKNNQEKNQQEINFLVKDKKEEIQVCYSENHQEFQILKNFFHKEYEKIWMSGFKGINNKAIKAKKYLYGEKLNQYIKTRSACEEAIHTLHQNWKNEVNLLKTQDVPLTPEQIKEIDYSYQQQIKKEKDNFNQKFLQLITDEQEKLIGIKEQLKKDKLAYSKEIKSTKKTGGK